MSVFRQTNIASICVIHIFTTAVAPRIATHFLSFDTSYLIVVGALCSWLSDDWSLYQQPQKILTALDASFQLDPLTRLYHELPRPQYHTFSSTNYSGLRSGSAHVSTDVLHLICQYLDASALFSVSCTCRMLRDVSSAVIPGLALTLYPHQYTSGSPILDENGNIIGMINWFMDRDCSGGVRGKYIKYVSDKIINDSFKNGKKNKK